MRNKGKDFECNQRAQKAVENIKREVCETPVLGVPTEKGMYFLDTDASGLAIAGLVHQEQEWNGRTVLRPIAYGSKALSNTEMKTLELITAPPELVTAPLEELKVPRIGHNAMMEQDAVPIGYKADVTAHLLDTDGKTKGVTTLLDTGAVVSVMPIKRGK